MNICDIPGLIDYCYLIVAVAILAMIGSVVVSLALRHTLSICDRMVGLAMCRLPHGDTSLVRRGSVAR